MIRGLHAMFYSSKAEELRAFFRDTLGFPGTDVGGGWLIFNPPEADLGVHPTEGKCCIRKSRCQQLETPRSPLIWTA